MYRRSPRPFLFGYHLTSSPPRKHLTQSFSYRVSIQFELMKICLNDLCDTIKRVTGGLADKQSWQKDKKARRQKRNPDVLKWHTGCPAPRRSWAVHAISCVTDQYMRQVNANLLCLAYKPTNESLEVELKAGTVGRIMKILFANACKPQRRLTTFACIKASLAKKCPVDWPSGKYTPTGHGSLRAIETLCARRLYSDCRTWVPGSA